MDLALSLDAGTGPVSSADGSGPGKAPGTDPNDATAVAFASLLAGLVAATAPVPDPAAPAVPEDATAQAAVDAVALDAPSAPMPTPGFPVAIALPAAPAPQADVPVAPPAATAVAVPAPPAAAPTQPDAALVAEPAAHSAQGAEAPQVRGVPPEEVAPEEVAPSGRHESAPEARPTAVQLPEAVAPVVAAVAAPELVAEEAPAETVDALDVATPATHPAAHAPAAPAREVLKPEIVTGPRPHVPASPVEQVVKAVAPLRKLADGTHNVVLELHPAELGAVRVELSLDRGMVHLGLRADVEGTGHLLRAALPELRQQLDAAGLTAGRVAVDADQSAPRQPRPEWQANPDQRRRESHQPEPELVPTGYSTSEYGRVDVRL
jgi:flagellar hook-length control protein FliK